MDNNVRRKILQKIKVSSTEMNDFELRVEKFRKKLKRAAKKLNFDCDFFVGGSFGKGTYLKGKFDVDIFCRFSCKYADETLSDKLREILDFLKLKYKKQKGSRDYFSFEYGKPKDKILFELIPNFRINDLSEGVNSTDYSPMHVLFLKEKIAQNPNLSDEIRLAKQFFKAKELYGAESYINGFSGHVLDILITYYGSLENLIEDAKNWSEEKYIDIKSYYKDLDEALDSIGQDKRSNLILIDPILMDRNAARALSNEKYCEFIMICQRLKELSLEDFEIKKASVSEVIENAKKFAKDNSLKLIVYEFKFKIMGESEDIVGSKLLKINKKTKKYFEDYDFRIFLNDFFIDISLGSCLMIFMFEKIQLSRVKKIHGPKVFMKEAVDAFLRSRDIYFIEDSRVCVYDTRVILKIDDIYKLKLEDFGEFLAKDISFVKSLVVKRFK